MLNGYETCILTNENDIMEYEKCLYNAYYKSFKANNNIGWIFKHYLKIDNCRLRPDIPYEDQLLYAIKDKNKKIVAGITVHIKSRSKFICEEMGFKIKKTNKVCEGLTAFITDENNYDNWKIINELATFSTNDLIGRGFKTVYGTTTKEFLEWHKFLFSWDSIKEKTIEQETRFLLTRYVD